MVKYDWAANEMKCILAQADCKALSLPLTEENVKAAYVKRAGLVYDTSVEVVGDVEVVGEPKVEVAPVVRRRVSKK